MHKIEKFCFYKSFARECTIFSANELTVTLALVYSALLKNTYVAQVHHGKALRGGASQLAKSDSATFSPTLARVLPFAPRFKWQSN